MADDLFKFMCVLLGANVVLTLVVVFVFICQMQLCERIRVIEHKLFRRES